MKKKPALSTEAPTKPKRTVVKAASKPSDTVQKAPSKAKVTAKKTIPAKPETKKPAAKKAPAKKVVSVEVDDKRQVRRPAKPKVASARAVKVINTGEGSRLGRPPEYSPAFIDQMIEYFNIEVDRVEEIPSKDPKTGAMIIDRVVVQNTFPTLTRFASKIGVTRKTLHEWATEELPEGGLRRPEFSYAYARAKDLQDALITEGGMSGRYEARFASFAAKNLIGWKDQIESVVETKHTHTTTEELDAIYAEKMRESQEKARLAAGRPERLADGS